jgi:hypothetical protein
LACLASFFDFTVAFVVPARGKRRNTSSPPDQAPRTADRTAFSLTTGCPRQRDRPRKGFVTVLVVKMTVGRRGMTWQEFWQVVPPPLVGGAISGICTLFAAGLINLYLNRNIKSKEFVFQFTQRYHDILGAKHRLNYPDKGERTATANDAQELYRRLFGLIYDEWWAYQHRFLAPGIFTEWMKWRRDDYQGDAGYQVVVANLSYKDAWDTWGKMGPLAQSDFSDFLDEVHNSRGYDDVVRVVKEHAPGFFGTIMTGQAVLRRTIFLSRLIGLFAVAVAVSMFHDRASMIAVESAIVQNSVLLRTGGMAFVIAGLSIVLGHHVWRGGLPAIVVTILGWLTLLRGLFALWAPSELVMQLIEKSNYSSTCTQGSFC